MGKSSQYCPSNRRGKQSGGAIDKKIIDICLNGALLLPEVSVSCCPAEFVYPPDSITADYHYYYYYYHYHYCHFKGE